MPERCPPSERYTLSTVANKETDVKRKQYFFLDLIQFSGAEPAKDH